MKTLRSLISRPQNSLLVFLVCLMVVLTVVFFLAMFVEEVETYLYEFVGVSKGSKIHIATVSWSIYRRCLYCLPSTRLLHACHCYG